MDQLERLYEFKGQNLRVVSVNDEPWFVAKDVCDVLELVNVTRSLDRLEEDEKGLHTMNTLGGKQNLSIVSESGLYELIFASRKPEAKVFKKWVKQEVLPSIRKHGAYMTQDTIQKALTNPDFLIQLATQLKDEQQKRIEAQRIIEQQRPIVDYYQRIMNSTDVVATTQIAQDYGLSAFRLNQILHEEGVQYKLGGQWILYGKYQGKGYVRSQTVDIRHTDGRESVKMHTKWTQKGRVLIHRILENRNIYPQADMWKEAQ
jgi:anti-repressor protein